MANCIEKEFKCMMEKDVWSYVKKTEIPQNRRLEGSKWVLKVKRDGRHHTHLCALGYSQVPGVDYTDNFGAVINDTMFRVMLVLMMEKQWAAKIVDVEMASLYGSLEEKIFMKKPKGLEFFDHIDDDKCLMLKRSIYGLVQAA